MGRIIESMWYIFILFEFFIMIITYYYLKQEYVKASGRYCKKNYEVEKNNIAKKEKPKKNIVKMNITQHIDAKIINEQVGYAQLEFIRDGGYISSQRMFQDKVRIGRDYRNDIVIKDLTVSRQQCLITKRDSIFVLRNFSDKNITRLNDKVIKNKAEIKYGDVVTIGRVTFRFNNISEMS